MLRRLCHALWVPPVPSSAPESGLAVRFTRTMPTKTQIAPAICDGVTVYPKMAMARTGPKTGIRKTNCPVRAAPISFTPYDQHRNATSEALSARSTIVRYDPRGCGLSDRFVTDLSLPAWDADLKAVADTIGAEQFVLLGLSQGGALAIDYAVAHPERVAKLVLINAYAQGGRYRARTDAELLEAETLVNLVRVGWGVRTRPSAASSPTSSPPAAPRSSTAGGPISSAGRPAPRWRPSACGPCRGSK